MFTHLIKLLHFVRACLWSGKANITRLLLSFGVDAFNAVIKVAVPILMVQAMLDDAHSALPRIGAGLVAAFLLMLLAANLLPVIRSYLLSSVRSDTQTVLLERLLRNTYAMKLDQHLSSPTGRFPQLLTAVYSNVEKVVPTLHGELVPAVLDLTAIICGLFYVSPVAGGVGLAILAVYLAASSFNARRMGDASKKRLAAAYGAYGGLLAAIGRYRVAHQFGNVEYEVGKAREVLEVQRKAFMTLHRQEVFCGLRGNVIAIAGMVGITLAAFQTIPLNGAVNSAMLASAMLAAYFAAILNTPLRALGKSLEQMYVDAIECEKIIDFTSQETGLGERKGSTPFTASGAPHIAFRNVSFAYEADKGRKSLDGVSFDIRPGQTVAIVGESGAGKSTLVNLLLRYYVQDGGDILVNGQDIRDITADSLRAQISVVSQNPDLFQGSIAQNIAYGNWQADHAALRKAAFDAGLDEWLGEAGRDLDEQIGASGDKISGGQKQRVALARALLKDGGIFLFDEATSALDVGTEKEILRRVEPLIERKTALIITHRITNIVDADWIVYMQEGRVLEQGTFFDLLACKGAFHRQLSVECEKLGVGIEDIGVNLKGRQEVVMLRAAAS